MAEFNEKEENGQVIAVEYEYSQKANDDKSKKYTCPRQTISKTNFSKYEQKQRTWNEFVTVIKPFILGEKCQLNEIERAFKTLSKDGTTIDMNKMAAFLNVVAREFNPAATGITDADVQKFVLQGDANGDGNIDQSEFIQMIASGIGNLFISSQK